MNELQFIRFSACIQERKLTLSSWVKTQPPRHFVNKNLWGCRWYQIWVCLLLSDSKQFIMTHGIHKNDYKIKSLIGPSGVRTRVTRFKVWGAHHYTIGPKLRLFLHRITNRKNLAKRANCKSITKGDCTIPLPSRIVCMQRVFVYLSMKNVHTDAGRILRYFSITPKIEALTLKKEAIILIL